MTRTITLIVPLLVSLVMPAAATAAAGAQDVLETAKAQYDAAAFEEALATLNAVVGGDEAQVQAAQRYRALSLMALGRIREAEEVMAAMIAVEPLLPTTLDQQSPRFRALARRVWDRLLPDLVRQHYDRGRARFDRGEWSEASREFRLVVALLDGPHDGGTEGRFADIRTLAADFLQLAAAHQPDAGNQGAAVTPVAGDEPAGTVPPVPVWQYAPPSPLGGMRPLEGTIDLLVNARGSVESVKLLESVQWVYDPMLLMSARMWRFKPAQRDGLPVPYRLKLHVQLGGR